MDQVRCPIWRNALFARFGHYILVFELDLKFGAIRSSRLIWIKFATRTNGDLSDKKACTSHIKPGPVDLMGPLPPNMFRRYACQESARYGLVILQSDNA